MIAIMLLKESQIRGTVYFIFLYGMGCMGYRWRMFTFQFLLKSELYGTLHPETFLSGQE